MRRRRKSPLCLTPPAPALAPPAARCMAASKPPSSALTASSLSEMFPSLSLATVEDVVEQCGENTEIALEQLLAMTGGGGGDSPARRHGDNGASAAVHQVSVQQSASARC